MDTLSESKIKDMLSRLYWDVEVEPDQLHRLLNGEIERIGHVDILNPYYRMHDDIFYGRSNSLGT